MMRYLLLAALVAIVPASARAGRIDFSTLTSANVSDGDGQTFTWTAADRSGTVNVRADWPNVTAVDGALRASTRAPASFDNPFVGTIEITFSEPVEILLRATIASLIRDGLSGGRFERVLLATEGATFVGLPGTTAIYTGGGTSVIIADDEFSPSPTVSNWGFVGIGEAGVYEFQYASTTVGLSETFDVFVVPEPAGVLIAGLGLAAIAALARASVRRRSCNLIA